ncbi:putative late blight resistance protein homolog R1A-3 [Salvia miltiorrhiza]|uniref:putative late blight resistance protein homolog R1A-3 n=1 Tax=Salvia miltiorrhiza TaxID=226208 RepID=UPI0025AC59C6|nr:putative late blight resistance protein homolog R1A-3 [Salvia miltiorrhiza]
MAAYAALASLLNTTQQMMTHPPISTSFHNIQIQSLEEKAALLLDFIETYNYVGGVSEEAQDLESLIASAAHTAEDMIESHIVNQLLPLSAHDQEIPLSSSLYLQKESTIEEKNEAAVGDVDQFHGGSNQAIEEPAPHVAKGGCWINFMQLIKRKRAIQPKNEAAVGDVNQFHGESNQTIEEHAPHVAAREARDLESLIASAAHTAEDMIESHIVNQLLPVSAEDGEAALSFSLYLQKKRAIQEKNAAAVGDVDQFHGEYNLSNFDYLRQIIEDMDALIEKANELKEKHRFREDQPPTHSTTPLSLTQRLREETAMVGFHDELIQLLDELTGHRSNLHIISIVGMGGMGKTTLAKTIYSNQLIIERFDIRAWATVSQQYNAKQILQQLLSDKDNSSKKMVDELGEQLHKTLSGRRYLIILDDIWSVEAWDEVRCFFPNNGSGSRILLTTRLSDVANNCGSSCLSKSLLNENESWELFCKKAFQNEDCPTELEKVGKEIVRLCRGLALSIVVIGGRLLKSSWTVGYWESVAKDIESSPNSKEKQESLDVLVSSYNYLPSYLKPCFLHIGVLKHINCEKLNILSIIQLWVAEGFLKSNGGQVLEEVAEDYLKELIDRNLIIVEKRSKNWKMKYCDIHDLLRDLCLKVAEQQGFFHAITLDPVLGTERRLVYHNDTSRLARSIMCYRFQLVESHKHRLLRILYEYRDRSVEELLGCVNLRYIAFQNLEVSLLELPSSLSLLWNLHSLIFQKTSRSGSLVVAPIEIWKMRQLRHIECGGICLPHPNGQDELLILENLQTLGNAVNLRLSEDVCNIIPNIKILHLQYNDGLRGYDDSLMECLCNLDRLHKLESLKLRGDIRWRNMYFKLNEVLTFPNSLNKLILRGFEFEWDDLTIIGSLPLLEVLVVRGNWVMAETRTWSPVVGQFQRLKFLKIYNCFLRCWNADSCHFPNLEKLILHTLNELEEIPWGIAKIPTLKLIHVKCCSNSAAISALKIKDYQLEYQGNDDLQIQIHVSSAKLESFMAMVETEGLTLDNVQFDVKNIYKYRFPSIDSIESR